MELLQARDFQANLDRRREVDYDNFTGVNVYGAGGTLILSNKTKLIIKLRKCNTYVTSIDTKFV